nr:DUF3898 domain-containing protein [Bacillus sp. CDB3]
MRADEGSKRLIATTTISFRQENISFKIIYTVFYVRPAILETSCYKINKYYSDLLMDSVTFEKGFSPIEFLRPDELQDVIGRIENKQQFGYDPSGIE